jgi:hypothetical protein
VNIDPRRKRLTLEDLVAAANKVLADPAFAPVGAGAAIMLAAFLTHLVGKDRDGNFCHQLWCDDQGTRFVVRPGPPVALEGRVAEVRYKDPETGQALQVQGRGLEDAARICERFIRVVQNGEAVVTPRVILPMPQGEA